MYRITKRQTALDTTGMALPACFAAQVTYVTGDLRVSGGGLLSEYGVEQFHFHWGGDDTRGSEHTINGVPFPMEVRRKDPSLKEATVLRRLKQSLTSLRSA